jgi:hypothetical protein
MGSHACIRVPLFIVSSNDGHKPSDPLMIAINVRGSSAKEKILPMSLPPRD